MSANITKFKAMRPEFRRGDRYGLAALSLLMVGLDPEYDAPRKPKWSERWHTIVVINH